MIHQYKMNGYNIVLDVYSGSVHAVDDVAYDAIALMTEGESLAFTALFPFCIIENAGLPCGTPA